MKTLPFVSSMVDIMRINPAASPWPPAFTEKLQKKEIQRLWAIGDLGILENPLLAFFCSSKCPGQVILRVYDLARSFRDAGVTVISGFHSPMEKECFEFLLRGDQPIVICPARGIDGMRLPMKWRKGISENRLLLLSPFEPRLRRPTQAMTEIRNRFVAMIADSIMVAYANAGSKTERLCMELLETEKCLYSLDVTENIGLKEKGAIGIGVGELPDFFARCPKKD
ncbi:MAG: DNA-processing protein DprA [Syntrophobacteraceae bacterium]